MEVMVNGRKIEDELKRIDDYFENITIEELEEMAMECGIAEIAPSAESRYVMAEVRYGSVERYNVQENKNAEFNLEEISLEVA